VCERKSVCVWGRGNLKRLCQSFNLGLLITTFCYTILIYNIISNLNITSSPWLIPNSIESVPYTKQSVNRSCVWDKTLSTLLTTLDRVLLIQATFNVTETIQDIHAWNTVIRSKRVPNPDVLPKIGRWHELDTVRALISKEVMNQRPDGIVVDANLLRIYVTEVARTEDSTDTSRLRAEEYEIHPTNAGTPRSFPWLPNRSADVRYRDLWNDRWTSMTTATNDARPHRS
jgi:hypothetical protein